MTTNIRLDLAIEYRNPSELKADPKNPRIHSDRQIKQIVKSIATFGFNVPILVDKNLKIIAGHGRVLAGQQMNLEKVPVISLESLTAAQARAFMIADNKLTENAGWDGELLAEHFKELGDLNLDFSLDITGFEIGEIDLLIGNQDSQPELDDELPDGRAGPLVTKPGDIWQMDKHRLMCGNSLDDSAFSSLMNGEKATLVFSDPPYNVPIAGHVSGTGTHNEFAMASGEMSETEFTTFLAKSFRLLCNHSILGSIHFTAMDWRHGREILAAGEQQYTELKNVCVWVKDNGGMGSFYRSQHEFIYAFKNGNAPHINNFGLGQYGRYRTNVWKYVGTNSFARNNNEEGIKPLDLHPTVKPVAMIADAIMDCSERGHIVLDPFLGSGSTLIAAERTGRTCYGLELDPRYVDTAVGRWQKYTGGVAINAATGRSFDEMASLINGGC